MRYREARVRAASELKDLEDPLLEAELLLRHVTGWSRHVLLMRLDSEIPPDRLSEYLELVDRRRKREPLQHLTGTVDFMGLEFHCGPGALVPRPETETLAWLFSEGLGNPSLIADVGTGSGVLAVTLALRFPECLIVGSDISIEALALASRNRLRHRAENLQLVAGDLLEPFISGRAVFDGMVANLPYVPSGEIQGLQPEVSKGDPRIALDGGPDGLRLVERLLDSAGSLLAGGGFLALELGTEQTGPVRDGMAAAGLWEDVSIEDDLTGRPRFVTARRISLRPLS